MTNQEYLKNAEGHLVPRDKVKPEQLLEDKLVNELFQQASEINIMLSQFKASSFDEVQSFVDQLAKKYGGKKGGKKGNMTFTSFDGLQRVVVSVQDFIQFGPQLQVAKGLIDECIKEWNKEGSNENIAVIVNKTFRVDKEGQVNRAAILGLRNLNIKGAKWKRAMDAIADSIRVTNTKRYIRFMQRSAPETAWQTITLDFAAVA